MAPASEIRKGFAWSSAPRSLPGPSLEAMLILGTREPALQIPGAADLERGSETRGSSSRIPAACVPGSWRAHISCISRPGGLQYGEREDRTVRGFRPLLSSGEPAIGSSPGLTMEEELRILILNDTPGEEKLIIQALRSAGLDFSSRCVSSTEQFARELEDFKPDLILSDGEVPGFQGQSALSLAKEKCPDVPFLYLSATNDAEAAVEALRSGAADYLSKDRLSHLAPSLLRARKESRERIRKKQIDLAIRTTQENYELAVRGANDGLWHWDLQENRLFFSPRWKTMLGYEEHEIGDSPEEWFRLIHPADLERVRTKIRRHIKTMNPHYEDEHR